MVDSEQLPRITEVVPCRTDSPSPGLSTTSALIAAAPLPSNTVPPRITRSKFVIPTHLSILASIQSILSSMLLTMSPVKPHRIRPTRDEVRDRILDAASKVFAAEGFAGATIDAIGQAAGFTKGAVYSNFGSKDELFLALLDREFELRGEQIATALESGGDTAAAAQALSRSVLDSVHGHADYYVLFVEYWLRAVRDPELRERLIARRHAAAADQAHNIVESTANVPSGKRLADLAQLVVTINLGIAMEEVLRPGTIDPDLLANLITGLLDSVAVQGD